MFSSSAKIAAVRARQNELEAQKSRKRLRRSKDIETRPLRRRKGPKRFINGGKLG